MLSTSRRSDVEVCLPRLARFWLIGFGGLWCTFGLSLAVILALTDKLFALILFGMVAVGAMAIWRWVRLRALAHGEEIVIRNPLHDHRLVRAEITGFTANRYGGVFIAPHAVSVGWTFVIEARLLSGKTVPLEVTRRSSLFPRASPKLNRHLAELQGWLDNGSSATPHHTS